MKIDYCLVLQYSIVNRQYSIPLACQTEMKLVKTLMNATVGLGLMFLTIMQCVGETPMENDNNNESVNIDKAVAILPENYQKDVYAALLRAGENQAELLAAIKAVEENQREEVAFLIADMPDRDLTTLKKDFLVENIEFACKARQKTEWAKAIPRELFLNYVLPYVNVNERRDNWRKDFYNRFIWVARRYETASDVALELNSPVFRTLGVRYHATRRPKPDQSPYESIEAGYASCTGLSILFADICRAVGVPARLTGVPKWTGKRGNHTWVEIWDGQWKFLGGSEKSPFNQTWFVKNAANADASKVMNRIYAASYKKTGTHFPLIWDRTARYVHATDVTGFYTRREKTKIQMANYNELPKGVEYDVSLRWKGEIIAWQKAKDTLELELIPGETYEMEIRPDGSDQVVRKSLTLPEKLPSESSDGR